MADLAPGEKWVPTAGGAEGAGAAPESRVQGQVQADAHRRLGSGCSGRRQKPAGAAERQPGAEPGLWQHGGPLPKELKRLYPPPPSPLLRRHTLVFIKSILRMSFGVTGGFSEDTLFKSNWKEKKSGEGKELRQVMCGRRAWGFSQHQPRPPRGIRRKVERSQCRPERCGSPPPQRQWR